MRFIGYTRVSDKEQVKSGYSQDHYLALPGFYFSYVHWFDCSKLMVKGLDEYISRKLKH